MRFNDAAERILGLRLLRTSSPLVLVALAAFVVAGTASGGHRAAAGPGFKVVGKFATGKLSTGANGLAVDKAGNVYVADSNAKRIQMFSASGAFRKTFTLTEATGVIADVAFAPDGGVWGATQVGSQLFRFPAGAGTPLKTIQSAEGIGIDAAGNLYVSSMGSGGNAVVRFDKTADGWGAETPFVRGLQAPGDVEVSPDGTIYVADRRGAPPNVKRYDASGKLLKKINVQMQATAGAGVTLGIGVDLDCNLWVGNAQQRNVAQYSPSGKLLATATSGDMIANDIVFGRSGDFYVFDVYAPNNVVHFAPDRAKPATAVVGGSVKVANGVAKVKYTLSGVACPAEVAATASLSGAVTGKASVKVAAGKSTVLSIPVKGKGGTAQFKIVLKTNGRPTTQTASVNIAS